MIKVNGPTQLASAVAPLAPQEDEVIVVSMIDGFIESEVIEIKSVPLDSLESWRTETVAKGYGDSFAILHGLEVNPDGVSTFVKYAESMNAEDGFQFLDSLLVDWEKGTYVSDLCTDIECCDPEHPKEF